MILKAFIKLPVLLLLSISTLNAIEEKNNDDYSKIANDILNSKVETKAYFFHQCLHIKGDTLRRVIEPFLSPSGTVASNRESDMVIISDKVEHIENLKRIITHLDREVPQVMVEARIVEFTIDSDFEKEVSVAFKQLPGASSQFIEEVSSVLGTPGANPSPDGNTIKLSHRTGEGVLSVFLHYLQTAGKAEILSAPSLALLRGEEGSIITGEEVPILTQTVVGGSISTSTEFKSVGIKLRIKPLIISQGQVRLEINPEVSAVTGFSGTNPIIAIRNARTVLKIMNEQMVAIGGLMRTEKREVDKRVPVLASIPILGWFFRSKRIEEVKTQLVIFVRLKILDKENFKSLAPSKPLSKEEQARIDQIRNSSFAETIDMEADKKLLLEQKDEDNSSDTKQEEKTEGEGLAK